MTNIFDDAKKYAELVRESKQNPQGQAEAKNYVQTVFETYVKELARAMKLKAGYVSGINKYGMVLKGISLAGNPRIDFLKALSLNSMAKTEQIELGDGSAVFCYEYAGAYPFVIRFQMIMDMGATLVRVTISNQYTIKGYLRK